MKKTGLILLICLCFQQRALMQNAMHSKLQFTSKEKSRGSGCCKKYRGPGVILVDQYSGVNTAKDMYDDIHPNETGEEKMAEKWYWAINKYIKKLKN